MLTVDLTLALDAMEGLHVLAEEVRRLRYGVVDAANRSPNTYDERTNCVRLVASELAQAEGILRKVQTILTLLGKPGQDWAAKPVEVAIGSDSRT